MRKVRQLRNANPSSDSFMPMMLACSLSKRAFATPNPNVGCVLVQEGKSVGKGHTQPVGGAHAEVMALQEAGENARGATVYVTLEPCSHFGRTPPCTDALIAAGVAKVYIATLDNDPRVAGNGVRKLQEAGIEVEVGMLEERAKKANEDFFYFNETKKTFVTLKAAVTLDGKTATAAGDSKWITGELARAYVHKLRAKSGAVLAGIETLLADDARLDARAPKGEDPFPRQPLRIILDSRLRTPTGCAAVRLSRENPEMFPLLIATTEGASRENEMSLAGEGVEILRLPEDEGRVSLSALLQTLAERNIISLFVEGGGEVHAAFLKQRLVNKLLWFIAPKILGGRDSLSSVGGSNPLLMTEAIEILHRTVIPNYPPDILVEGYLERA